MRTPNQALPYAGIGLVMLSPREREVLGLMAQGMTNTAIAGQLVVSDGAVEKQR